MSLPPLLASLQLLSKATFRSAQGLIDSRNSTTVVSNETLRNDLHITLTILDKLETLQKQHDEDTDDMPVLQVANNVVDLQAVQSLLKAVAIYGTNDSSEVSFIDDIEAVMKRTHPESTQVSCARADDTMETSISTLHWATSCLRRSSPRLFSDDSPSDILAGIDLHDDKTLSTWHVISHEAVKQNETSSRNTDGEFVFSLWAQPFHDTEDHLLCHHASFSACWLDLHPHSSSYTPLFTLCGDLKDGASTANGAIHHDHRLTKSFFLLPTSLLISTASRREWKICVGSLFEEYPVLLTLRDIPIEATQFMLGEVEKLALLQATIHTALNFNTLPICVSQRDDRAIAQVMKSQADTMSFADSIYSATFEVARKKFTVKQIRTCQIIIYKCMDDAVKDAPQNAGAQPKKSHDLTFAELLLPAGLSAQGPESLYAVRFDHQTRIGFGVNQRQVLMSDAVCVCENGATSDRKPEMIICSTFCLEFTDKTAAHGAISALQAMQREIWISYLSSCRVTEEVPAERRIGDFNLLDTHFPDASLQIVEESNTAQCRLIVTSKDLLAAVCMDLTSDVLQAIISKTDGEPTGYTAVFVGTQLTDHSITSKSVNPRLFFGASNCDRSSETELERHEAEKLMNVLTRCKARARPPSASLPIQNKENSPQSTYRKVVHQRLSRQEEGYHSPQPTFTKPANFKYQPRSRRVSQQDGGHFARTIAMLAIEPTNYQKSYENTIVKDNSSAHFGDVIHNHYHVPPDPKLVSLQIEAQLSRLRFFE